MRAPSAFLLIVVAAVHLNLYEREEYDKIPTVGLLFLLTVVSSLLLAAALSIRPVRLVHASVGLFALGVLGGYVLTLTLPDGLFSFKEPRISYSGYISIVAEAALVAVSCLALAKGSKRSRSPEALVTAA